VSALALKDKAISWLVRYIGDPPTSPAPWHYTVADVMVELDARWKALEARIGALETFTRPIAFRVSGEPPVYGPGRQTEQRNLDELLKAAEAKEDVKRNLDELLKAAEAKEDVKRFYQSIGRTDMFPAEEPSVPVEVIHCIATYHTSEIQRMLNAASESGRRQGYIDGLTFAAKSNERHRSPIGAIIDERIRVISGGELPKDSG